MKLRLLGTPAIETASGSVAGRAAQGRRLGLLAILVLARGRPVSRDRVVGLLWPESPTDRARHQLSDTLYILRSGLAEGLIRSVGDDLHLAWDAIEVDTVEFERLLDEGRLAAAVDLFAGPLLDGFHVSDASEFERWLDAERAALEQRYGAALESLARASERNEDFATAAAWWRRRAAREPYSGRIALCLMRSLEAAGDRAGAIRHARTHSALLREEFDAEPDPEIAAFAERLRIEPPVRTLPEPVGRRPADRPLPVGAMPVAEIPPPAAMRSRKLLGVGAVSALLLLSMLGYVFGRGGGTSARAPRSVAVLPFVDLSPESRDGYLSDGLSEEIIAALTRLEGVHVAARTSSFALRGRNLDARAIGDTLDVSTVLEGSVRRQGNRLRVTAQLIDAASGYHIWSTEYDRQVQDIFTVEAEIAAAIARALELPLRGGAAQPDPRQRPSLEAYDLYLRGLYLRNSLSADGLRQAAAYFDRSIALEPGFALAYAGKASVVAPLMYFGHVPLDRGIADLRDLTGRALELDPDLGEAWASLGILRLFFEWDWEGAEQALRRAIELNPGDAHARHHLSNYLGAMGRFEEAVAARERAVELDPLNARTRITLGSDYLNAGRYDRALAEFLHAARLDPVNPLLLGLGPAPPFGPVTVYLSEGRFDEAVNELVRLATLRNASPDEVTAIGAAWHGSGTMPAVWRAWLDMDSRQSGDHPDALRMASLHALAGDTARAFDWLDRAYRERNPGLIYLGSDEGFANLRSHPRFVRIRTAMGLPEPALSPTPAP